jgi:hypothetical protein
VDLLCFHWFRLPHRKANLVECWAGRKTKNKCNSACCLVKYNSLKGTISISQLWWKFVSMMQRVWYSNHHQIILIPSDEIFNQLEMTEKLFSPFWCQQFVHTFITILNKCWLFKQLNLFTTLEFWWVKLTGPSIFAFSMIFNVFTINAAVNTHSNLKWCKVFSTALNQCVDTLQILQPVHFICVSDGPFQGWSPT